MRMPKFEVRVRLDLTWFLGTDQTNTRRLSDQKIGIAIKIETKDQNLTTKIEGEMPYLTDVA